MSNLPEWIETFKKHISICEHDYCAREDKPILDLFQAVSIAWEALEKIGHARITFMGGRTTTAGIAELAMHRIEELGK